MTKKDPKDQGKARPRKPTAGSRSGEARPPQGHRERTEDPRRARPKGGPKNQKRPKVPRAARPQHGPKGRKGGGGRGTLLSMDFI